MYLYAHAEHLSAFSFLLCIIFASKCMVKKVQGDRESRNRGKQELD